MDDKASLSRQADGDRPRLTYDFKLRAINHNTLRGAIAIGVPNLPNLPNLQVFAN